MTSRVLIGRADERARLDAALTAALTGRFVMVLVSGEAGIGETRLVADFVADAGTGATVLRGACITSACRTRLSPS